MSDAPWWASQDFWRKCAIFVTAFMAVILIVLTFDTVDSITRGGDRVPAYGVINYRIGYEFGDERNMHAPVVGREAPLFATMHTGEEARALADPAGVL